MAASHNLEARFLGYNILGSTEGLLIYEETHDLRPRVEDLGLGCGICGKYLGCRT